MRHLVEWLGAYESDRERRLMDKGIGAMDKKRFKQAVNDTRSILKSNPDFTEAWNKRATVQFLQFMDPRPIFTGLIREPRFARYRFGIDQHASERT